MYKRKTVVKLTGNEHFSNHKVQPFTVLDFWKYGFSNLNSNVLRGALAEFIVESALKKQGEFDIRNPWGDYDVEYSGKKIEVKSCSYIQDWDQKNLSLIKWSGLKAKSLYWSSAVSAFKREKIREYKSDIYVLALLNHQETDTLDIFNLNQWCFYILSKEDIKMITKDGNSVSLSRLKKNGYEPVGFDEIKESINSF